MTTNRRHSAPGTAPSFVFKAVFLVSALPLSFQQG
jgi:hypothetical protein